MNTIAMVAVIRSVQDRTFVAAVKTAPRVTLGKSVAESQGGGHRYLPIYEILAGILGVGARIAGVSLR